MQWRLVGPAGFGAANTLQVVTAVGVFALCLALPWASAQTPTKSTAGAGGQYLVPIPKTIDAPVSPPDAPQTAPPTSPRVSAPTGPVIMVPPAPDVNTPLPPSAIPPPSAAEVIAVRRLGPETAHHLMLGVLGSLNVNWDGRGSPQSDAVLGPAGSRFFSGQLAAPSSASNGSLSRGDSAQVVQAYKGVPGGVVLEGAAAFGPISTVDYDPRFNALILNGTLVYFMRTPPRFVAMLADAIADDDRVGVSLGNEAHIVYGRVPPNCDLALDLKLADNFLGEITFARADWTRGYKFAGGYTPKVNDQPGGGSLAVFFSFNGYQFTVVRDEIRVARENFDVRVVPLKAQSTAEGDLVPDDDAIGRGDGGPPAYRANAQHIADNIPYYRRERIIDHAFEYGAVAAFLRGVRAQGFDLHALARSIVASQDAT